MGNLDSQQDPDKLLSANRDTEKPKRDLKGIKMF